MITTGLRAETATQHLATLDITIEKLRSDRGKVALLLCPADSGFPDCNDRAVRKAHIVIAKGRAQIRFTDIPPGAYAIAVFHDANDNKRMDKVMGIPKEGYGFSRNPPFKPRAPRFSETAFQLSDVGQQTIYIRYLF